VNDTNVLRLSQPGTFADPLTEVLRNGARALLAQAVEAEVAALLASHADELTDDGRARLVRHGHLPEREIMTGIGPVAVRCPRVRDRIGDGSERIRFSSAILPPYARRVDKETRIAIDRYDRSSKHVPRIRPVAIEHPMPQPPNYLERFYFNSKWLALRVAQKHPLFLEGPTAHPNPYRDGNFPLSAGAFGYWFAPV
jgi:hypothetical protein